VANTPIQVIRGGTARFEQRFLGDDSQPLIPLDPSAYPAITITSPTGEIIQQAVASPLGDGRYYYNWIAPADLPLSDTEWMIEWVFITPAGRQIEKSSNFGIIDHIDTQSINSHVIMAANGQTERLFLKLAKVPAEISVTVKNSIGESETYIPTLVGDDSGYVTYYADTTELWTGNYSVVWTVRDTLSSPKQLFMQQIRVPEDVFWSLQPHMRMFLDKVQLKDGSVMAYSDADMYEYLNMGMGYINTVSPISNWSLNMYPGAANTYLMAASAYWGLNAQYLAAADTAFSFSGQAVTLDVDRTAFYADAMARLKEFLDGLKDFKANLMRMGGAGTLAVRPITMNGKGMVIPVGVSGINAQYMIPLIRRLGL